ncbi:MULTISPECIES: CCA tRNA nucleotidyltransferase [Rhodomicrobium]|uniref:CCA tRNA nucleotidyltransferase n=1 Tax=Rhodomicrobium TaxID=1068 RepID=UPI000B4B3569|nr:MULTISPECIES: CCA tRNA nucleotidyltransferase [Rhodomicrobium]
MAAPPDETGLSVAGAAWFQRRGVEAVFAALNRDGHEARIVGGALRNTLMGLPVGDIDFAATARPDEIIRFTQEAGLKPVPTGIEHGTVTVVVAGTPFEVTTLRRDVETHGRRATVAFTRDWAADAARRDFTINALYAAADGRVIDPLGGLPDLRESRVRFIHAPRERIREDYLRILRFFRFTADYAGGAPDAEGLAACVAERAGLAKLSPERVHAELFRILVTRRPLAALEPMAESGLLTLILGGVTRLAHFERLAALETALGENPAPIRRLAALAVMVEEDAARLALRLRLSNAEAARLDAMAALEPVLDPSLGEAAAREALYRLGSSVFRDRVLITWARSSAGTSDEDWRGLAALPGRWKAPVFPLKGQDLLAHGIPAGPRVGALLRALEAKWVASGFAPSREDLLSDVDETRAAKSPHPVAARPPSPSRGEG